ncbi:MAG TPA: PQQ-binding-like beta-propeller repeat protein [Ideonella sp.]|uniref:outer membrane protein assembly factor BamB family protein n=1 Tax=Ideonella sp. TaxID=1929293 RepID=UPI002CA7A270|nr:PQQ-binding-like beta-propeller repeat protein [Ideonella sp.]HSI48641.1 PQQ-binding-like beta-propeller repeat protein [Ideonella sp.]
MPIPRFLSLALLAAAACAAATPAFAKWPQEGYSAAKSQANTDEATLTARNVAGLQLKWQRQLGQFYASAVTQAGPQLLACSNLYDVSALQLAGGASKWDQLAGVGNCGTPATAGGQTFLVSSALSPNYRNVVSALDTASGHVLWETDLMASSADMGLNADAALSQGRLYVSSNRGQVVALDTATGQQAWRATTGGNGVMNNDPAVAGGRVFVSTWLECCGNGPRKLHAYDAETGVELWATEVAASNMQRPAQPLGDKVVVTTDSGLVNAYDAATGALSWSRTVGFVGTAMALHGQAVYVPVGTSVLALDAATGNTLWTRPLPSGQGAISNLVWANGLVYLLAQNASSETAVVALKAGNGKLVASVPVSISGSYARLSLSGGMVYISANGTLSALGL